MKLGLSQISFRPKAAPLSQEEVEYERKAKRLPSQQFRRIDPVPGTLAYLLRNEEGGNLAIANYLRMALKDDLALFGSTYNKFLKLVKFFDNLDEDSKRRIDLWDHCCIRLQIPFKKFIVIVQAGAYDYYDGELKLNLISVKREVVDVSRRLMKERNNFKDRELMAKATGLIDSEGVKVNVDASTKITNNNLTLDTSNVRGFRDIIKRQEELVKDKTPSLNEEENENNQLNSSPQRLELTEGSTDFIDTELIISNDLLAENEKAESILCSRV